MLLIGALLSLFFRFPAGVPRATNTQATFPVFLFSGLGAKADLVGSHPANFGFQGLEIIVAAGANELKSGV